MASGNLRAAGAPSRTWPAANHPTEDLFRLRKAILYTDIIEAGGLAEHVDGFTEGQWAALALIAKGKPPSSETCAMIRGLLQQRQEWRELVAIVKREAQAYLDWYAGLVAAGETPKETIAQWELRQLADLQAKAHEFKQKLLAKVESGTRVQPGPLTLTP